MGRPNSPVPLSRHTINLRVGDMDFLTQWGAMNDSQASAIIRKLVSTVVDKLRETDSVYNSRDLEADLSIVGKGTDE